MSSDGESGARVASPPGWDRLEANVRRLLDAHAATRRRAEAAETRAREAEARLAELGSGRVDPVALSERAEALERENARLRERLERAATVAERMRARLQLVEDER